MPFLIQLQEIGLSGRTRLVFTSHLRPGKKTGTGERGADERGKRILSEALESVFTPGSHSPAVRRGNCTVMAFYVAALRWLIIYTLHTPSPCFSNLSKLMACSEPDGER